MNHPEPVILTGDCLERLKELPDASVDAVITDPPYGLSNTDPARVADTLAKWATGEDTYVPEGRGFMGASWDGFVPPPAVWKECLRVLKPGGHLAVFAGSRTQDLMGLSVRLAGFEIRDSMGWIFGSGFPKSHNISKAIDKAAGAEREVIGFTQGRSSAIHGGGQSVGSPDPITAPATDEAKRWDGWGTSLKPAIEPIILARKPLDGTVANNVLAHGVGGLNIDASRVPAPHGRPLIVKTGETSPGSSFDTAHSRHDPAGTTQGRFPANVLLDEHAAAEMDKQSGNRPGFATQTDLQSGKPGGSFFGTRRDATRAGEVREGYNDSGGASRFFPVFRYQAKAPKKERPVIHHEDGTKTQHATVKPLALMEWLVTLLTPEGGTVLDPFAGSGTTLEAARNNGFHSTGIEREEAYVALIHERLNTER